MSYTLIQTVTLTSDQNTVTFSSIPATFDDLVIVSSVRNSAGNNNNTRVRFNGDTGSNYSSRLLYGTGSGVASYSETTTSFYAAEHPPSTYTANTFGNAAFYIPNYRSSVAKSMSADSVVENNATASWQQISAHLWNQTSAITSVSLFPAGNNFATNSSFSLYGITRGSSGGVVVS